MDNEEKELRKLKEEAKKHQGDIPVSGYIFPCGCKIIGTPPIVGRIIFCTAHKNMAWTLISNAPNTAKKVLDYWTEIPHGSKEEIQTKAK